MPDAYRDKWPEYLVRCIVQKNFVCVVGSGLSSACENSAGEHPPGWSKLIADLADDLLTVEARRQKIRKLLRGGDYLAAAELLRHYAVEAGKAQDLYAGVISKVESPNDPYLPSRWHDELLRLDPVTLATTNFDKILERATAAGYAVKQPADTKIDVAVRSSTPIIIKMHGSVDHQEDIVLCQSDYARLRQKSGHMMEVIQALLMTRTCLFLGYSLDDPDMQLLLENVLGARGIQPAHFLLGPKSAAPYRKSLFEAAYGVTPLEYKADDHSEGLQMLKALADLVDERKTALLTP